MVRVFDLASGHIDIVTDLTPQFYKDPRLVESFEKAAERNNGVGGGHPTAAGLNITTQTDPETVLKTIQDIFQEYIPQPEENPDD